jgi:isopenicillin N synthase-like dioxygenase
MSGLAHFDFPLATPDKLRDAAHRQGCFYIRHPLFPPSRCAQVLKDARAFFQLPAELKATLAIEHSAHFRGYSQMRNQRDWREQIHFGREEPPAGSEPPYQQLRGPNLWSADKAWRSRLLDLLADFELAGREVLCALSAEAAGPEESLYLLLKLIHYEPSPDGKPRSGVAPHVDFSWITLLLQDDTGGLEVRTPEGEWLAVPPVPGTLVVNVGEILQFASGGYYAASPHRVTNRAPGHSRISLPFFLNPALDTEVVCTSNSVQPHPPDPEHVHRVFQKASSASFVFGEAEWSRKGLGIWCSECVR